MHNYPLDMVVQLHRSIAMFYQGNSNNYYFWLLHPCKHPLQEFYAGLF
jgi:hypothetical protein